jgi:hypothetical protein
LSEAKVVTALPVMFINKGSADISVTDAPCELLLLFIIWEAKWTFTDILACDISTGWF